MKQKIFWASVTFVLIIGCLSMPAFQLSNIQKVKITQAEELEYTPVVSCQGEIENQDARKIYMELPFFPKEILVETGDFVTAGQVLATVDRQKTWKTFAEGDFDLSYLDLSGLLGEYDPEQLQEMLEKYLAEQQKKLEDLSMENLELPAQIVAPVSGVVSGTTLQKDVLATPFQPVFTIEPDAQYFAVVTVPEAVVSQIQVGQKATVSCSAIPEKTYEAEVTEIASAAQKKLNGTVQETVVEVFLKIKDWDEEIKNGYTVLADIFVGESQVVYTIPYETIYQNDAGQELVYVFQNGVAVPKEIETGVELSDCVQIRGGSIWRIILC